MEALKASLAKKSASPGATAPAEDEAEEATGTEGRPGPRALRARRATHLGTRQEELIFRRGIASARIFWWAILWRG